MTIDYLIVGQGLAGTLLSHFLEKRGISFLVVDAGHEHASSKIAAGIVNPITGKNFVKSWRFDAFFAFAIETYQELESKWGLPIWYPKGILRSLHNYGEVNAWMSRTAEEPYKPFMEEPSDAGVYKDLLQPMPSYGVIHQAGHVDMPNLIRRRREQLIQKELLLEQTFDYTSLTLESDILRFQDINFRNIVFCEGANARFNRYFQSLPFQCTKGEALILQCKDWQKEKIVKQGLYFVALSNGHLWAGSNYAWVFPDVQPTEKILHSLQKQVEENLKAPYRLVQHLAAIRPTTRDRRPFIGRHPAHSRLWIFNGLGTKGASLGPYWASHLVDVMVDRKILDPEVDIARYNGGKFFY